MDLERRARGMSARKMFSEHEINVLYVWPNPAASFAFPSKCPPDVRTFVIDLARLAGIRPSKRQPLPGTEKIWQAWRCYKDCLNGVNAWEERREDDRVNNG